MLLVLYITLYFLKTFTYIFPYSYAFNSLSIPVIPLINHLHSSFFVLTILLFVVLQELKCPSMSSGRVTLFLSHKDPTQFSFHNNIDFYYNNYAKILMHILLNKYAVLQISYKVPNTLDFVSLLLNTFLIIHRPNSSFLELYDKLVTLTNPWYKSLRLQVSFFRRLTSAFFLVLVFLIP